MLVIAALCANLVLAQPRAPSQEDPLAAIERHQHQLFERLAPGVVFISRGDAFGSGFFVSADGLILTNNHVVGPRKVVDVVMHDGRKLKGEVLERADKIDLALVKVPVTRSPLLSLGSINDLKIGSWVGAIGHGEGMVWTFNTGMISNIYPNGAERPIFQTEIPVNPGNSGGPIFDRRGQVVGVVTAGLKNSNNINFGIVIDVARRSFARLSSGCECVTVNAPPGIPVFVNGEMAGTGPRVILPASANQAYEIFAVISGSIVKAKVTYPAQREVTLK